MTRRPWRPALRLAVHAIAVGLISAPAATSAQEVVTREVTLMGTTARLTAVAPTRPVALSILDRAVQTIEDTEAELSTWRASSAISRFNVAPIGVPSPLGPALCEAVAELVRVSEWTGGAFDPAIGQLTDAWGIHGHGRIPGAAALASALRLSGMRWLRFDEPACTLTRNGDARLDVGAWGKGEALDRVRRALPDATWLIDFGGQIAVNGRAPGDASWTAQLAHPRRRQVPVAMVDVPTGSLSTSAGSERDLTVQGHRVAHHLDPRTGRPASFTGSVVVWHERALTADALSTALYVMGPDVGRRWAETHGVAATFLTVRNGEVHTAATSRFRSLRLRPPAFGQPASAR